MRFVGFLVFAFLTCAGWNTGAGTLSSGLPEYGVNARVSWRNNWEFENRDHIFESLRASGIGCVRCDCTWLSVQREKGQPFDFSLFDQVVESAEKFGITILPILQEAPKWALPQVEHLQELKDWVRAFATHYAGRIAAFEFWNEENGAGFWQCKASADDYFTALKAAHEAVHEAGTDMKIIFGGTTGIPLDYFGRVFSLGGLAYCDAIAFHPYVFPSPLEGEGKGAYFEDSLDRLRAMMAAQGAVKPVWITEVGWPTHTVNSDPIGLVRTSLKVARPEKKSWRIVYAALVPDGVEPDQTFSKVLQGQLPEGSTVVACAPKEVCRRIAAGEVDAVMYPTEKTLAESYPEDTAEAVVEFVRKGGTLLAMNGCPMWRGCRERPDGSFGDTGLSHGAHLKDLRVGMWLKDSDPTMPRGLFNALKGTPEAATNGFDVTQRYDLNGMAFFDGRYLKPGDRFVPLLVGEHPKKGGTIYPTGVYLFDSDMKGRVVVSALVTCGGSALPVPPNSEESQARMLIRAHVFAFAKGVDGFVTYCLRAFERNPLDSEDYYGITHRDLAPKPAFKAMRVLTKFRPSGSVNIPEEWRSADGHLIRPVWRRPDGRRAGAVWTTVKPHIETLRPGFTAEFRGMYGERIGVKAVAGGYEVPVSDAPVFFVEMKRK